MIGTDLNLTLPSTTETMATNIARIATALQSIEDSIAERVSPAGININPYLWRSVFTSNGNFVLSDDTRSVRIRMTGGGGGGGGVGGISCVGVGGGGASGVYIDCWLNVSGGENVTVVIGAGGTAGSSSGGNGGNGESTTVTIGATTITAPGGAGGFGMIRGGSDTINIGGGTSLNRASSGDARSQGNGNPGFIVGGLSAWLSGAGGSNPLGVGGSAVFGTNNGNNDVAGGGGSGAAGQTGNRSGGAGGAGLVIIEEYDFLA